MNAADFDPADVARADQTHRLAIDLATSIWHAGHLQEDGRIREAIPIRRSVERRISELPMRDRIELEGMLLTMVAASMTASGAQKRTVETAIEKLAESQRRLRRRTIIVSIAGVACVIAALLNVVVLIVR